VRLRRERKKSRVLPSQVIGIVVDGETRWLDLDLESNSILLVHESEFSLSPFLISVARSSQCVTLYLSYLPGCPSLFLSLTRGLVCAVHHNYRSYDL
jgi:hypothetical protein